MPSAWSLIDASFPTFTGEERVRDQVDTMLNYMFMLAEGLKYQLSNLSSQNFNTTALRDIQIETTADVETALEDMMQEVDTIKNSVNSLRSSLLKLEEWQETADEQLKAIASEQTQQGQAIADLGDILDALKRLIKQNEDGSITIGAAGTTLQLLGNVYINGTLVE